MSDSDFTWGTVTATGPLRIRLDGDSSPLPFAPDSLIDPATLVVSDRVRCEIANNKLILIGRSGGLVIPPLPAGIGPVPYAGTAAPSGWLECNGAAISRITYADLFAAIGTAHGAGDGSTTFNLPNVPVGGSPVRSSAPTALGVATFNSTTDLVTLAAHGRAAGQRVTLTNSGGALPTGLSAAVTYFVVNPTATTLQLSLTLGGSAINFTSNGTGTTTLYAADFVRATAGGEISHSQSAAELAQHRHFGVTDAANDAGTPALSASNTMARSRNAGSDFSYGVDLAGLTAEPTVSRSSIGGSGQPANNMPPYLAEMFIIKT